MIISEGGTDRGCDAMTGEGTKRTVAPSEGDQRSEGRAMVRRFASASRFAALIMVAGALAVACSSTTGSPVLSSVSTMPTTHSSSTIELTYRSGSTPPPYHYEWTFTVEGTKGSLAFRAGYSPDQTTWTESFDM